MNNLEIFRIFKFLIKININSVLETFIEYWNLKDDEYLSYSIDETIFSYKVFEPNYSKLIVNNKQFISINKDKSKFSFVVVDVNCPLDLNIPLLLTRYKSNTGSGHRSIPPVGNWTGVYTSIEINRAIELVIILFINRLYTLILNLFSNTMLIFTIV